MKTTQFLLALVAGILWLALVPAVALAQTSSTYELVRDKKTGKYNWKEVVVAPNVTMSEAARKSLVTDLAAGQAAQRRARVLEGKVKSQAEMLGDHGDRLKKAENNVSGLDRNLTVLDKTVTDPKIGLQQQFRNLTDTVGGIMSAVKELQYLAMGTLALIVILAVFFGIRQSMIAHELRNPRTGLAATRERAVQGNRAIERMREANRRTAEEGGRPPYPEVEEPGVPPEVPPAAHRAAPATAGAGEILGAIRPRR